MKTIALPSIRSDRRVPLSLMRWATLVGWWRRRRTLAAIRHLDTHLRRDIGLGPIPPFAGTEAALRMIAMTAWR